MATVMPESEGVKKAIKWISACIEEDSSQSLNKLIEKAALQFDLSPLETDFLFNFFKKR
ncbi:MAG: hypothetical protein N2317_08060 [Syntrophales bacterium]|nr:hypothetical protein [Syntrophales bacterium]